MSLSTLWRLQWLILGTWLLTLHAANAQGSREKGVRLCSDWSFGPCEPLAGPCGPGARQAGRHGLHCRHKVKTFPCFVICAPQTPSQEWRGLRPAQALTGTSTLGDSALRTRKQNDRKERRRHRKKDKPQADDTGSYQSICTYKPRKWNECNSRTNKRQRTLYLSRGSSQTCKATTVEEKACHSRERKCVYRKQQWTECNPLDRKMTRRLNLLSGGADCEFTRVQSRPCAVHEHVARDTVTAAAAKRHQDCRYDILSHSKCDPRTHRREQTLKLRVGDRGCKAQKTVRVPCTPDEGQAVMANSPQDDPTAATGSSVDRPDCKYRESDWGPCKSTVKTKRLTLSPSSPSSCPKHMNKTKSCVLKVCRYKRGKLRGCKAGKNFTTREDTLVPGSDQGCAIRRPVIITNCELECRYLASELSECNEETGQRTLIKTRAPGSPLKCPPTQEKKKSCKIKTGQDRCFLGSWSDLTRCEDGTKTRTRKVLAGGVRCEGKNRRKIEKIVDC